MSRHSIEAFKFKICRQIKYEVCGKKVETIEYLNYEKIPGIKKYEQATKDYSLKIPVTELNGHTQLLGSMKTDLCSVEYFCRIFVKVKSVFEIGQGICVQFPINIINKPSEDIQPQLQLDKSFKIHGLPKEFEEGGDLEEGVKAEFNYARDAWTKVDKI